ncbi:MAG: tyrosine-type recombinase/integrase [Caldilineaceae bacterium]
MAEFVFLQEAADEGASMTTQIVPIGQSTDDLHDIVRMVTNSVTSDNTKRAYGRALTEFLVWHRATGQQGLNKATVNAYVQHLRGSGRTASSINQALVAIRKMAREAADNNLIDHAAAEAIARSEGVRTEGRRLGNWLTQAQAQSLLDAPDIETIKGLRDRAILAVLLGCGLRREECAALTVQHLQQREGRWVIVDLEGKRNKMRSVPMPSWAKYAVDAWLLVAGISTGAVFRPVNKGSRVGEGAMTAQAIYNAVSEYADQLGLKVHPHDLRRTFAKLAHKGKSPLEQIQLSLGHASIQTTERYLGVTQDLTSAPCDVLGLRI